MFSSANREIGYYIYKSFILSDTLTSSLVPKYLSLINHESLPIVIPLELCLLSACNQKYPYMIQL